MKAEQDMQTVHREEQASVNDHHLAQTPPMAAPATGVHTGHRTSETGGATRGSP
jgi:hypothetical protein